MALRCWLRVQTFVSDESEPRQNMSTAQMINSCARIIAYTSPAITLQPGDRIRTVISKLGELRFTLT